MEEEKTDKPKRSRLRTLLIIFLTLSLVTTGGGVAYWFWLEKQSVSTDEPKAPVIEKVDPVYVPLNTFTVSLKPTEEEADRVLYLGITVSFIDSQSSATLAKFMPEYRSRLFMLFTQQTF
jgi:Flagellar basal body-associated protein